MAATVKYGEFITERLRKLDNRVARSVSISEREICDPAARFIEDFMALKELKGVERSKQVDEMLKRLDQKVVPNTGQLIKPERTPTKDAPTDLGPQEDEETGNV